jgi:hypothetical protein
MDTVEEVPREKEWEHADWSIKTTPIEGSKNGRHLF